jgi:chemotaxis protein MotA
MDLSTVVGLVAGVLLLGIGMASGGSLAIFWDPPSIAITIGGSLAAMMINFPLSQFVKAWRAVRWAFFDRTFSPERIINSLVGFAEKARREGLLALEDDVSDEDAFLKKGIQLVVDGTDPELVKSIMDIEISFLENRHRSNQMFFETWGSVAPAFGMAGTLIGLIQMLRSMGEDLGALGPAMAVALITTLYGVILAYLIFIPLAGKLKIRSSEEIIIRQVMVEGILSIQAGENPRIVEEKLKSFLAPAQREGVGRQRRQEGLDQQGVGVNV